MTVLPRSTDAAADFTWGRERFVAEGRTLASLQDAPGIVRVFDFLEANGTAYIVMQLLQGETLENRLKRAGPLPPAEVDRILWPLLDGLEQVHNAGFLHRDIKPANILLDAAGNPTLIDFGASRAAMAGRSTALTAIFTPGYAAAEQMTSAKQGPWTDIYGLSATLYHAITGQAPPSAFDRMLDDAYEPLGKMALPGFPPRPAGRPRRRACRARQRPAADHRRLAADPGPDRSARRRRHGGARPPAGGAAADRRCRQSRGRGAGETSAASVCGSARPRRRSSCWPAATTLWSTTSARRRRSAATRPRPRRRELQAAAQRLKDQEELARLRAESEQRQKAEQEAAQRRQIEEETRRKVEAEMAEQAAPSRTKRARRPKPRRSGQAQGRGGRAKKAAEAAENGLRLTLLDRQHVQVALDRAGLRHRRHRRQLRRRARAR